MNHRELKEWLEEYLEGRCTPFDEREVSAHLETCARCRKEVEDSRAVRDIFGRLARGKVSPRYEAEFARRLAMLKPGTSRRELRIKFIPVRSRWVPALATAATVLIVIGLGAAVNRFRVGRLPVIMTVAGKASVFRAAAGQWVPAEPGMRINEGDRLITRENAVVDVVALGQYRYRCLGETRIIAAGRTLGGWVNTYSLENGHTLFQVERSFGAGRFTVNTPAGNAVVAGTEFEVRVARSGESRVAVVTGSVILRGNYRSSLPAATVTVNKEKTAIVSPFGFPSAPAPLPEEDLDELEEAFSGLKSGRVVKPATPMREVKGEPKLSLILPSGPGRVRAFLKGVSLVYSEDLPAPLLDLLREAHTLCREGKSREGIAALEEIVSRYPDNQYNTEILLFIASLYYSVLEEPEQALAYLDRVVREDSPRWDALARCATGMILDASGKRYRARAASILRNVTAIYPETPEGKEARAALDDQDRGE